MSTGVGRMDTTLGDAKTAIDQASTISHGVAANMYGLRDAMNLEIPLVGTPLAGLAPGFDTSGQNLDALGTSVAAIGTSLEANRTDVTATAGNLSDLANSVHTLTTSFRDVPPSRSRRTRSTPGASPSTRARPGWSCSRS